MNFFSRLKYYLQKSASFIYPIDFFISKVLIKIRNKFLNNFFKIISVVGDWWVWTIFSLSILPFNIKLGILIIVSQILQVIFQKLIKNVFVRKRPYIKNRLTISRLIVPPDKFSFPSGHTAGAFVVFFCLNLYLPGISLTFLVIAILIGISRIYLGVHYFTDVLFGVLLGFVAFKIGKLVVDYASDILNIQNYLRII